MNAALSYSEPQHLIYTQSARFQTAETHVSTALRVDSTHVNATRTISCELTSYHLSVSGGQH